MNRPIIDTCNASFRLALQQGKGEPRGIMIRKIRDVTGTRSISFDFNNKRVPGSIFIMGSAGYCIEIPRQDLMEAFKTEFNLFFMDLPADLLVHVGSLAA